MDAVEYLKEFERMCRSFKKSCTGCGMLELKEGNEVCIRIMKKYPKESVAVVERWSAEHPVKTLQSKLLKVFPDAEIKEGVVRICPNSIDKNFECKDGNCDKCLKSFWLSELQ